MKRGVQNHQTMATVAADASSRHTKRERAAAARTYDLLTKDQPPPAVQKHEPRNTHTPGSVALSVLGGRVIR